MSRINDKSQIGPQPGEGTKATENSDGQSSGKAGGHAFWDSEGKRSRDDKTHNLVGEDITNLLLLELLRRKMSKSNARASSCNE